MVFGAVRPARGEAAGEDDKGTAGGGKLQEAGYSRLDGEVVEVDGEVGGCVVGEGVEGQEGVRAGVGERGEGEEDEVGG